MSQELPEWLRELSDEDLHFVRRFILASGSLKELARMYSVSYPTVRARLDRLIQKVKAAEDSRRRDPFDRRLHMLVADGRISPELAKDLMAAHKASQKSRRRRREQRSGAKS